MYGGKFAFQNRSSWLVVEGNLPFLLCFALYSRANSKYKLPRGLTFGGAIVRRVFCVTILGGLISGEAYTWRGLFSEFHGILKISCFALCP